MTAGDRHVIEAFRAYLVAAAAGLAPAHEVLETLGVPDKPAWFDETYESFPWMPAEGTMLGCGCHLRRGDFETVLCPGHLAEMDFRPAPPRPDKAGRLPGCPCGITGPHDETTPSLVVDPEAGCPWHGALVVPAALPAWVGSEPQEVDHDDERRPVSAPPAGEV
jgi:hypothetical protein